VIDHFNPLESLLDDLSIKQTTFVEVDSISQVLQILPSSRAQIIQHSNAVPSFDERRGDMRADKSGSSGDQKFP